MKHVVPPALQTSAVTLLTALLLAGCQQYPMGLSQEQWDALPPAQQAEYQRQQTQLNEQRRQQQQAAELARQQQQAERDHREQERIRIAHARARYRDVISVTIQGGLVAIGGKHQYYEPVRFDLVRGEKRPVEFVHLGRSSNRSRVDVRLSDDGNTFYFDEASLNRIVLINNGWEDAKSYGPLAVRDAHSQSVASAINVTIQFKELPGAPPRKRIDSSRPK